MARDAGSTAEVSSENDAGDTSGPQGMLVDEKAAGDVARLMIALDLSEGEARERYISALQNGFTVDDIIAANSAAKEAQLPPGKFCEQCPMMVTVPAGTVLLGAPEGEKNHFNQDEFPQVAVEIPAFEISMHEITFAEYDTCVENFGCTPVEDEKKFGRGNRPVVNVNFEQVEAYIAWLNRS